MASSVTATGPEIFRDWSITCSDECVLSQASVGDDRELLAIAQLYPAKNGIRLDVAVPMGVHLASGLFVAAGKPTPKQLEWIRCGDGLCLGSGFLAPDEVAAWRRAYNAEVRYRPGLQSEVIELKFSLLGFSAALDRARSFAKTQE